MNINSLTVIIITTVLVTVFSIVTFEIVEIANNILISSSYETNFAFSSVNESHRELTIR